MKKTVSLLPLTLAALVLGSCSFSISIPTDSSQQSSSPAATSSAERSSSTKTSSPAQQSEGEKTSLTPSTDGKVKLTANYSDYGANNIYGTTYAPTVGEAKLLVVPVWFSDSSNFISASKKETVREDIRKAYFGSSEETGWHSVKSYYETESLGKLSLSGTVTDWYETRSSYRSFGPDGTGGQKTDELVETVADWFFENNPGESRSDYDRDDDGYLDGVMLIYAAPNYVTLDSDSYGNLWAYCYWVANPELMSVTSPGPNVFFWASYDFMYGTNTASSHTGKSYHFGDTSHCNIDAHTYIHEMGHVFGLDDYYDYGPNGYNPAAGFSMQDHNIGGHDPFSVMAFGWADPYIPTESCSITISAFQKSHDVILLTPAFNEYGTPFDEYLLLELYTPTGLNELDSTYAYSRESVGPKKTGIRLWHVDARLAVCNNVKNQEPVFDKAVTSDVTAGYYGVIQAFTNTYGDSDYGSPLGSVYDNYNLLHLIRNSKSLGHRTSKELAATDLFANGDSFSMNDFRSQFPNAGKLNSKKDLGWSFSVSIEGEGDGAKATVNLIKD